MPRPANGHPCGRRPRITTRPRRAAIWLVLVMVGLGSGELVGAQPQVSRRAARDPGDTATSAQANDSSRRAEQESGAGSREPSGLEAAVAIEKLLVAAIAKAERSVVAIARIRQDEPADEGVPRTPFPLGAQAPSPTDADFVPNEFGAGVVVSRDGQILTNYHLLGDPQDSRYYVWIQRRPFRAEIVAADPWFDLAVLSIEAKGLQPIEFGDGRAVRKGQIVLALGNPQAIARDGDASASWGIISNVLRRAPQVRRRSSDALGRETIHHYGTLLQTDAKLNLGFSGGALIDLHGRMIGLTTSYSAGLGYETAAGFAIPVDERFLRAVKLLREGRRPDYGFLGVKPEPLAEALRRRGILGARLADVFPGTPASRAGLRKGDVVVRIDGRPVHDDDDLIRIVGSMAPDETTLISVVRENSISGSFIENVDNVVDVEVSLSKKRLETLRPQLGALDLRRWRGLQVEYVTAAQDFEHLADRVDRRGCVLVLDVERDSPAWLAGIRARFLISQVNGTQVGTPNEFYETVVEISGDTELQIITDRRSIETRTVSP